MILDGAAIVREVRNAVPGIKDARWTQPFKNAGYFLCTYKGSTRSIIVDMSTPAHVLWYAMQWTELRAAVFVAKELLS